jgi:hypothetical protein
MTTTAEQIGDVGVDSGCLWLGDLCCVMGEAAPALVHTWEEFLARTFDPRYRAGAAGASQPVREELGMAVPAGDGDGGVPGLRHLQPSGAHRESDGGLPGR